MVTLLLHVYSFEWMPAALLVFLLAIVAWLAVAVPAAVEVAQLSRLRGARADEVRRG